MSTPVVPHPVILRAEVGSRAHGLNIGTDDRDEMGVCLENMPAHFAGFEQFIYRSAVERTGDHNACSRPGDLDLTVYSLRKYVRLALKGNPTILTLLFALPNEVTAAGYELKALAPSIASRRAGGAFLGYMQAQRQRLAGERGGRHGSRPVGKHGYDTKYAGHILRLGHQGIELLETGRFSLPMRTPEREQVLLVRNDEMELVRVLKWAEALETRLKELLDTSPLPPEPDTARVEAWMIQKYRETWKL